MKLASICGRRVILKGATLAGAAWPWSQVVAAPKSTATNVRFGLILKMKQDLQNDWRSALTRVAALGVKDVEFPGTLGPSAQECRKLTDELGLSVLGGGGVYKEISTDLDTILATSQILGKKYVYCYWPWLDGGKNKTADDWKRLADTMNQLGKRIKAGGLMLAYHNHDIEFAPFAKRGPLPYDLLLKNTDPALVTMQMDLWWVDKAKQSPLPFLRKHPGRFASFHIKERLNTTEDGFVCSGKSFTDLPAILKQGKRSGIEHFVIENENESDHYGCAKETLGYLQSLKL